MEENNDYKQDENEAGNAANGDEWMDVAGAQPKLTAHEDGPNYGVVPMPVVTPNQRWVTGRMNLDLSAEKRIEAATWLGDQKRALQGNGALLDCSQTVTMAHE